MNLPSNDNEGTPLLKENHQQQLIYKVEEPIVSKEAYTMGSSKNQQVLGIAFFSFFFFTCVQMVFAVTAHSTSLMADAAAMFVDAGTYLCNLIAEKLKDRPPTEQELKLPQATLEYRIQLRRLNLELFPPAVSMALLLYITYFATLDSIHTLRGEDSGDGDGDGDGDESSDEGEANAGVMMFFGLMFLAIDFVNMFCFSTANGAMIPLSYLHFESTSNGEIGSEHTSIEDESSYQEDVGDDQEMSINQPRLNLNMCSAWTHVFADTLRSSTILVAGAVSFYFKAVPSDVADAWAAFAVSIIICISCIPLSQGIVSTALEIKRLKRVFKEECA